MKNRLEFLEEIIEEPLEDMDSTEKRKKIEKALKYERYTPSKRPPSPHTSEIYNPGVDAYMDHLNWTEDGWRPVENTEVLQNHPEYLPTTEAIELLTEEEKIIEIGAGNGYWAHVINENGGSCTPTDVLPRDIDPSEDLDPGYWKNVGDGSQNFSLNKPRPLQSENEEFPLTIQHTDDYAVKVWEEVLLADHTCVTEYENASVLLCHPPGESWTEELLDLMSPTQKLFLVAEWYPGADATPKFFKKLIDSWTLKKTFPVYDWASMHTFGYVFVKEDS